ncbi:MAG: hypothetical protein KBD56_08415 [Candidatus Eisenbacteria bacterium]|nr:hypothetical protein [Candidatus Eisenbacteria bacterium]
MNEIHQIAVPTVAFGNQELRQDLPAILQQQEKVGRIDMPPQRLAGNPALAEIRSRRAYELPSSIVNEMQPARALDVRLELTEQPGMLRVTLFPHSHVRLTASGPEDDVECPKHLAGCSLLARFRLDGSRNARLQRENRLQAFVKQRHGRPGRAFVRLLLQQVRDGQVGGVGGNFFGALGKAVPPVPAAGLEEGFDLSHAVEGQEASIGRIPPCHPDEQFLGHARTHGFGANVRVHSAVPMSPNGAGTTIDRMPEQEDCMFCGQPASSGLRLSSSAQREWRSET